MNILLLSSAFNGLTQRAYGELLRQGHTVNVRLAVSEDAIRADVAQLQPELILCPFLKDRVPADVYTQTPTLIMHPGRPGDRGPSSLDWTIQNGLGEWGVTVLEAGEIMDGGDIWASALYQREDSRKGSLYNGQSADAAMHALNEAVSRYAGFRSGTWKPRPLVESDADILGREQPLMRMPQREVNWTAGHVQITRQIQAADGVPGAPARLTLQGRDLGEFLLFDVHAEGSSVRGEPGEIIGWRDDAVLIGTSDQAIWIGHMRARRKGTIKLGAVQTLRAELGSDFDLIPERPLAAWAESWEETYQPIKVRRHGALTQVCWSLYNGAMSTEQLRRLRQAVQHALSDRPDVLLLGGGTNESFSNGIHLNVIDAATDPATEAWDNINAINDVIQDLLEASQDTLIISGVGANAGAGGVIFALAADVVAVREGVVLNPHYKAMGLYGSEFWTRLLPARVGAQLAEHYTQNCVPVVADQALSDGLVDLVLPRDPQLWNRELRALADGLLSGKERQAMLRRKAELRREADAQGTLQQHREAELGHMHADMYGDASGFAAARHAFVHKTKTTQTPAHVKALPSTLAQWPQRTNKQPNPELA